MSVYAYAKCSDLKVLIMTKMGLQIVGQPQESGRMDSASTMLCKIAIAAALRPSTCLQVYWLTTFKSCLVHIMKGEGKYTQKWDLNPCNP